MLSVLLLAAGINSAALSSCVLTPEGNITCSNGVVCAHDGHKGYACSSGVVCADAGRNTITCSNGTVCSLIEKVVACNGEL